MKRIAQITHFLGAAAVTLLFASHAKAGDARDRDGRNGEIARQAVNAFDAEIGSAGLVDGVGGEGMGLVGLVSLGLGGVMRAKRRTHIRSTCVQMLTVHGSVQTVVFEILIEPHAVLESVPEA